MCDVRCNALFAHILLAVWLLTPKIQFFLFLPPNQAASAARRHLHIFCANVSVHRRRLVRRTVERLVGLFIWFSAVLLWPIVLNVTVWSLFFALSMWKVHCTCGSLLFICPTSAFTVAPLAARKVERLVQRFHFSGFSCL